MPPDTIGQKTSDTVDGPPSELDLSSVVIPESLPLISERLDKLRLLIVAIEAFISEHHSIVSANIKLHERLRKHNSIDSVVKFEVDPEGDKAVAGAVGDTSRDKDLQDLNGFFKGIQTQTDKLIVSLEQTESLFKVQLIPQLKELLTLLVNKEKDFRTQWHKREKEFRSTLQATRKELEHFELSINKFDNLQEEQRPDFRHDPYLNRKMLCSQAEIQLSAERDFSNFVQKSESDLHLLEVHIMEGLKQVFSSFSAFLIKFHDYYSQELSVLSNYIQAIPNELEWERFEKTYRKRLHGTSDAAIPQNFNSQLPAQSKGRRSLETIQFPNQDHFSTAPILEGVLSRKDSKFSSKLAAHYYVITKSKLFYEFPSRMSSELQPTLVLFLPDCSLKDISEGSAMRFKLQGKDMSSSFLKTSRTLTLQASSEDDFKTWFNVISELSGLMYSNEDTREIE
ncbi:hypothetical protein OGAPHI_003554 [Ogataea philodendri]|uniref:PH domain-containing protein n=1 Tax=Ogataea philodendri TaxID=1378263 RepID=A0A9P8P6Z0_9ASCO|nr:uncharacterized protein OGAPHI_003554 [Ogataea philodendri]KAH3666375.1 hypothetical protein OGAPHI_003554 [Ogataea philodendri]